MTSLSVAAIMSHQLHHISHAHHLQKTNLETCFCVLQHFVTAVLPPPNDSVSSSGCYISLDLTNNSVIRLPHTVCGIYLSTTNEDVWYRWNLKYVKYHYVNSLAAEDQQIWPRISLVGLAVTTWCILNKMKSLILQNFVMGKFWLQIKLSLNLVQ